MWVVPEAVCVPVPDKVVYPRSPLIVVNPTLRVKVLESTANGSDSPRSTVSVAADKKKGSTKTPIKAKNPDFLFHVDFFIFTPFSELFYHVHLIRLCLNSFMNALALIFIAALTKKYRFTFRSRADNI